MKRTMLAAVLTAAAAGWAGAQATEGTLTPPPEAPHKVSTDTLIGDPPRELACKGDKPKSCPQFRAPDCVNGWWACTARASCPPKPDWQPPEGMRLACRRGEWTFLKACDQAAKPTCVSSQRALCSADGAWLCVDDGCRGPKPTCVKGDSVVCRENRWSCLDKSPGKVCPEIALRCPGGAAPVKGPDGCFDVCPKDTPARRQDDKKARKK